MFYDFKRTTDILQQLQITPNQAWFCIMLLEQDYKYKCKLFTDYCNTFGGIAFADIAELEQLGYIENCSNSPVLKTIKVKRKFKHAKNNYEIEQEQSKDVNILELFLVSPKFKDAVYIDPEIAGEEVLKSYPAWITIQGQKTSAKTITDREGFYQYYQTITNGDILKHRYICEMFGHYKKLLKEGKVSGLGITKALERKLYDDIQELLEDTDKERDAINDI